MLLRQGTATRSSTASILVGSMIVSTPLYPICYSSFLLSNSLAASLMILISSSSLISETSTGAS